MEALITPEQVAKYERSEGARNAIKLFSSFSNDPLPNLTRNDYCCMRDYLIFQISLQNSHRSGVVANMLVGEFNKANEENDFIRIKVKEHKTKKEYGPAKVYAKKHIYNYMNIFVDNVRNSLPVIVSKNHVFLSFNGLSMESGAISKQLNSIWQRAGVYDSVSDPPNKNLTTTIFRKSVSTAVLEHQPTNSKDVASLLAHSEKTQGRYYNARRRDLSTAAGAHHVGNLLRFGADAGSASPKKSWSDVEVQEIKYVFEKELEEQNISIDIVDKKKKLFLVLKDISSRKIYDKVRSLLRYKKNAVCSNPPTLPVESGKERCERLVKTDYDPDYAPDDSSSSSSTSNECSVLPSISAASSTVLSGKEKVFPQEDAANLLKWCASIISVGPITKQRIVSCLSDTEEKNFFFDCYGFEKIKNRLKYERKKKK